MPDHVQGLNDGLTGRYRIERELGRGGNAVVYLAHDLKHDRKVALKVLLPELALAVRTERFLREIQIAARLSHPHILPLHDSGEAGGTAFYVMPYVEGESLRDRLNREKQLSIEDALRVTREVAEALGYAHEQGVVHRDIKPENILLSRGVVVVADFGIARALTVAGGQTVTEAGIAVGTPAYMSPEQGSGSGEPDARSDIYSLGCVLYEMLVGHPPFTGNSAQEILSRHSMDPVPSVRAARPDVSEPVEKTIAQALAKVPVGRFTTARAFSDSLSRTNSGRPRRTRVGLATGLAILLLGWLVWIRYPGSVRGPSLPGESSVGVLVCMNLSTDPENEYFSQGMSDELISGLQRVPGLRVPALTSSLALKNRELSVRQAAEVLGVAHILECSVRRSGGRLKMNARLVRAGDQEQLWADTYDRELRGQGDVIEIQEDIAQSIVSALPVRLALPAPSSPAGRTADTAAYNRYLLGLYFTNQRTGDRMRQATSYFEQAIERDSNFALAYAGLSVASTNLGVLNPEVRNEAYQKSRWASSRAIGLDSLLADAHASLGYLHYYADWNWSASEREFRTALTLNPNLALAHAYYAVLLAVLGRFDETAREAATARQLDPLSTINNIGIALRLARRYDEAIREAERVMSLVPGSRLPRGALTAAYIEAGRFREALAHLEPRVDSLSTLGLAQLGYAYARTGRRREALRILAQREQERGIREVRPELAWLYMGLDMREKAVATIVSIGENRGNIPPTTIAEPIFDPLRDDPRIRAMRQKWALEP